MAPNSSTAVQNRATPYSAELRASDYPNGFRPSNDKFIMHWYTIAIIGVAILILSAVFVAAINWFLKERRCRKLRHRLIPLYAFDPNEDDDWDEEFFDSNQPLRIKDYQSIGTRGNPGPSSR